MISNLILTQEVYDECVAEALSTLFDSDSKNISPMTGMIVGMTASIAYDKLKAVIFEIGTEKESDNEKA